MFDLPGSTDLGVTVLLHRDQLQKAPAQSLVRIRQPDRRADVPRRGHRRAVRRAGRAPGRLAPAGHRRHHAAGVRAGATTAGSQVSILGEELADGTLAPPRLRPLPNSPVFVLGEAETAKVLKCERRHPAGAGGRARRRCRSASRRRRRRCCRGTRPSSARPAAANRPPWPGWSTRPREAGMAVVLLDVEGEYTRLNEPTDRPGDARIAEQGGRQPDRLEGG